jgi:hypothetical protein
MSLLILPGERKDDWAFENGKEILWYDENPVTKHVVMTSPMTPSRIGYNRHKTNQPKEMDRVYRKIHEQEREANEKLIEKIWARGRGHYEALRSRLHQRLLASDCKEWEKAFIREALQRMADRDAENQKNTRYGVSAMEDALAPLPGARTKVN